MRMEHHVRNFCHPNPPIDYKPFVSIKIITIDWFVLWMRKRDASMEYHFFFFFSKMGLSGFTSRLRSKSRGPFGKRKNNSWAKLRSFKSSGISSSSDRFSLRLLLPPPTSLALLLLKVPTGDNSTLHFVYPVFELLASVSPWTRRRLKTEDGFRRNIERTKLQYPGKKKSCPCSQPHRLLAPPSHCPSPKNPNSNHFPLGRSQSTLNATNSMASSARLQSPRRVP